jgi:hypothetical protein
VRQLASTLVMALLLVLVPAGAAHAAFGIAPGGVSLSVVDSNGQPDTRAGAHPDRLKIGIELSTNESGLVEENLRDLDVDLPPGLIGDIGAVEACPRAVFDTETFLGNCPQSSRVGQASIRVNGQEGSTSTPIVNVVPAPGQLGTIGFNVIGKFPMVMELRPDDYGVTLSLADLAQNFSPSSIEIELWGVPFDHQEEPNAARRGFLVTPTTCGEPIEVGLRLRSWQTPGVWHSARANTGMPLTGCGDLSFDPSLGFGLSNPTSDTPTGVDVALGIPESSDPDGLAPSTIENVTIALPQGMAISPSGAAGIGSCSDAQFGFGTAQTVQCPQASQIGGVEIESSLTAAPLVGDVFIGSEVPGDRFRLFLVARGPGVEAKFRGTLRADPHTGRLTTTLNDLPDIAFNRFLLRFDAGRKALLTTPLECGTATTTAVFQPRNGGPSASLSDAVPVDRNPGASRCDPPFAPTFSGGGSSRRAGHATTLSVTLRRRDGEESAKGLEVVFPAGLGAAVGLVRPCPKGDAAAGVCPAASRVGSAVIEAGAGPTPASLRGGVFLTESFRRAPFGLLLSLPAAIGPFDLGTLQVRGTLDLDARSGRVTVNIDSLPTIVEGIPIRFQTIGLDIDRPGFLRNPTSCEQLPMAARISAESGHVVDASIPFQLRGCERLRFRPDVSMRLTDRAEIRRRRNPGVQIGVTAPRGSANLRNIEIGLPRQLSLNTGGLLEICARGEAMAGRCPAGSRVGTTHARSPLVEKEMVGSVFLVQPSDSGLPDLRAILHAEGLRLDLVSHTSEKGGRLISRFAGLPDMGLSSLRIQFLSGKHGMFALKGGMCRRGGPRSLSSSVALSSHSGVFRLLRVPMTGTSISCKPGGDE